MMSNKIKLGYFIILSLFFLITCREDTISDSISHKQERSKQFFKTDENRKLTALQSKIIGYLQDKDKRDHFTNSLKDNKGEPQWSFIKELNTNSNSNTTDRGIKMFNGNILYSVPLTKNGGITSILYTEVKGKQVVNVREITNKELWKLIHNEKLNKNYREFILLNCLQYDKELFGNYIFINIPVGLLGVEKGMPNKIRLDINNTTQKMQYTYDCIEWVTNCTCPESWGACDQCNNNGQCVTHRECSWSWTDDGEGEGGTGEGGTGEGGTGEGGGGNDSLDDPCTESFEQFYRRAPKCGGSGGNIDDDIFNDNNPCERLKKENIKAKNLMNDSIISSKNDEMTTNISSSTVEKSFTFGKDAEGNYKTSDITIGPSNGTSVPMPANNPNFTTEGGIHNHNTLTYDVPSPGDIYWFWHVHNENSSFKYYFTNGANTNSTYAYLITDELAFASFKSTYSEDTYFDPITQGWKESSTIGNDFYTVYKYFESQSQYTDERAMELATAYVIGKYNMGIGISKKNENGDFESIFVKDKIIQIPIGDPSNPTSHITLKTYEITTDCNL